MKILVTGGSGYLGTHVRKRLGADDFSRRSGCDILNLQDVQRVREYDAVVHLAAHLDKRPDLAEEVFLANVDGTINILKAMKEGAAFVFASTKDVYGRFADNYEEVPEECPTKYSGQSALEWSKLIAERYVEYYSNLRNFRSCIFRLSTVYAPATAGNRPGFVSHYAGAVDRGDAIRLPGKGLPVRDILHVDDLTSAIESFLDSVINHGIYNLGGGRENSLTLDELILEIESASGLQAVVDRVNPLPDPVPFNYVSDIGLANTELGWKPSISVEEGLRSLFARDAPADV